MSPSAFSGLVAALALAATPLEAQHDAFFFAELGGPGGLASVNLEVNPIATLRLRAGAGFFIWPSIPLTATYTWGSAHHGLEVGAGATLVFLSAYQSSVPAHGAGTLLDGRDDGLLPVASALIGYRYTSSRGLLFRAGVTPLFAEGDGVLWFGLSVGRSF